MASFMTFNNGHKIPAIGIGTWNALEDEVYKAMKIAIDCGYRHIDTAAIYENECHVGRAVKEKIDEGVIDREQIFITTKLWNTHHRSDLVQDALEKSLENLQLAYVDLYLIHWPFAYKEDTNETHPRDKNQKLIFSDTDYLDTWRAMEKCVGMGLVRNIGVSNFNQAQLERLLANCDIKPAVNQIECHPYFTNRELCDYCKSKDIHITAYSPLGSPSRPFGLTGEPILLNDERITKIAKYYNKTNAQILIRYQIERGHSVIPKSVTKDRILSNFNVFDFNLTPSDVEILHKMNYNRRFVQMLSCIEHKLYPFEEK